MIGWEIGIVGGSLAALVYVFGEASKPGASPLFLWGGVLLTIMFFLSAGDSLYRVISKARFKERIGNYIADGQEIIVNKSYTTIYKTTTEYQDAMLHWSDKIALDIQKHKGKSEADLFLDKVGTQGTFSLLKIESDPMKRHWASVIVSIRLERLKELRERL